MKLATVLKSTLEGVEKLTYFLDAVEKLAVTSLQVFTGGEEVVKLSVGISLESVEDIISAARLVCPLLLRFKRDAEVFFTPSLHNVAVFEAELKTYIDTTEKICKKMAQSSAFGFEDRRGIPQVWLAEYLPLDVVQNISSHVAQLSAIREDKDFRLVFLFQDKSVSGFVNQFSECRPRMLQFLDDLEGCAVQLDSMKKAAEISGVVGSSVGIYGGVMAIVGLALAPVTFGGSLAFTVLGASLGIASGLTSLVTTVKEAKVNNSQVERANKDLQSFMQDVERIQVCLDEVTTQVAGKLETDILANVNAVLEVVKNVKGIGDNVCTIHDSRMTAKAPGIEVKAAKGTQAITAVGIGLNVLGIGLDIYTIVKDGRSLAKGEHSVASQFIRARAALLRSVVDGWSRIHDSVGTGMKQLKRGKDVLQRSF